ncbi:MAG: hypothetical protein D6712_18000, partial [Chloroflexi bacterium]
AENITSLRSVLRIDFAEYGDFESGWFALSEDGNRIRAMSTTEFFDFDLITGQSYRTQIPRSSDNIPAQVVDSALNFRITPSFSYRSQADVYLLNGTYCVSYLGDWSGGFSGDSWQQCSGRADIPQSIWLDGSQVWLEVVDTATWKTQIIRLPCSNRAAVYLPQDCQHIPYVLAEDTEAIVLIGRIPPPYAVTSSADGVVKLWNIQEGQLIASAMTEEGIPAVFGQLNSSATNFLWRDENSHSLRLINFATGEDLFIAPLNGAYVQYFFLTPAADVAIAVNLGFKPEIIAWNTHTGQQYNLGTYRSCTRIPDMARLSGDGTTLVIGCDTGLDIWRID